MSFQVQPQQQQQQQPQQPGQVYPNTFTRPPASPSQHSNGNFGAVFIVLAIIVVISAIACFLGRLCNKKYQKQKPPKQQNHKFRPKNHHEDIEFGLDHKKMPPMPSAKAKAAAAAAAGIGGSRGSKPHINGEMKGFDPLNGRSFKPHANGEMKGFGQKPSEDEGDQHRVGA